MPDRILIKTPRAAGCHTCGASHFTHHETWCPKSSDKLRHKQIRRQVAAVRNQRTGHRSVTLFSLGN